MSSYNSADPQSQQSLPTESQHQQHRIQELRVAGQELHSSRGNVWVQLSPGAVAFSIDRPVMQARNERLLRAAVEKADVDGTIIQP